jgi:translocation and assembly module TamB
VVDGGVLFAGLQPARWRFGINAEAIRVTYPEDVRSVIDGQLALQGNQQLQVLSGTVNVRRAEYTTDVELSDLLALNEEHSRGTFSATTGTGGRGTSPIRLDLTVEARDSIIVRNNLADVVASASLALSGPMDDPVIDGRATVTHGTINFRNGEYQVTRGVVRFPGRLGGDITFDLLAESEIKGYRVSIGLSGTPDKPYPVLRSEPPLPETQIVSLVLTGDLGSSAEGTSAISQSSVGLASSLLSEAVSRSVEKRTSKLFGINRFQIDPLVGGTSPSARLTLGRQVNKNLSIIYSTNITSGQEQVIQIEYRISDRFSVVATRDERGAFGMDFRVRKRF